MNRYSQVSRPTIEVGLPLERAGEMLREIRAAHQRLRQSMDEMERLTSSAVEDSSSYLHARFQISKASLARRTLFWRINDELAPHLTESDAAILQSLHAADRAMLRKSAEHVSRWSTAAIAEDWNGYCAASRSIRNAMGELMAREAALLYPLLQRQAQI